MVFPRLSFRQAFLGLSAISMLIWWSLGVAPVSADGPAPPSQRLYQGLSPGLMSPAPLPPGPAQSKNPLAERYRQQGARLFNSGDYRGAEQAFGTALSLEPGNAAIRSELLSARQAAKRVLTPTDEARNRIFRDTQKPSKLPAPIITKPGQ